MRPPRCESELSCLRRRLLRRAPDLKRQATLTALTSSPLPQRYPAAEMKHGPIALIDEFMPVVIIAPRSDPNYRKLVSNIEEVRLPLAPSAALILQYHTLLPYPADVVRL